jgi:hypothetical protein
LGCPVGHASQGGHRGAALPSWPSEIDREQLQQLAGYAAQYGVIKKELSLDDLIWEGAAPAGG